MQQCCNKFVYLPIINYLKNQTMRTTSKFLTSIAAIALIFSSCEKDHSGHVHNDEEVMTTLTYTLTAENADTVALKFLDLDGEGGTEPTITGGTLKANTIYTGTIEILNESESPAEDITKEILEEDEGHQFFFISTIDGLSVTYTDQDGNGNPIGQTNSLSAGAAGSGNLTVTLKHEPNKTAEGVSNGDITNAGGETDISVIFPITVE